LSQMASVPFCAVPGLSRHDMPGREKSRTLRPGFLLAVSCCLDGSPKER
jgi:hypothetical protein